MLDPSETDLESTYSGQDSEIKNNFIMLKNTFFNQSYLSWIGNKNIIHGAAGKKNVIENKNILFGTYGKTILFPISTGAKHRLLHTSPRDAVHNGLALAGDLLAIRDADKNIHFVNIKDFEKQGKSHHSEEIEATGAFAITPDGRHVFCQGKNGKACILDREKESFKSVAPLTWPLKLTL